MSYIPTQTTTECRQMRPNVDILWGLVTVYIVDENKEELSENIAALGYGSEVTQFLIDKDTRQSDKMKIKVCNVQAKLTFFDDL